MYLPQRFMFRFTASSEWVSWFLCSQQFLSSEHSPDQLWRLNQSKLGVKVKRAPHSRTSPDPPKGGEKVQESGVNFILGERSLEHCPSWLLKAFHCGLLLKLLRHTSFTVEKYAAQWLLCSSLTSTSHKSAYSISRVRQKRVLPLYISLQKLKNQLNAPSCLNLSLV